MIRILHIVPQVPPAVCGIGDYAWLLAQALRDEHDIQSSFLSAGTNWTKPEGVTEFPVYRLAELTTRALVNFVAARPGEFDAIVLHMSSYGYQKRGVPGWLASGWRQLSQMNPRPRLITMFHELFASGSASSSAFWLQPLQQHVLRIIARASDGLRTNREAYADWVRGVSAKKTPHVVAMPVFSNLGEPLHLPAWNERELSMTMLSWGIHSGEGLDVVVRKAASLGGRLGMKRLHLIGGKPVQVPQDLDLDVKHHGFMNVADFSALLASCRLAYTAYSPQHFGKSGLMAAFAAHGLAVITQGREPILPDGLKSGVNVVHELMLQAEEVVDPLQLEKLGTALRVWYDGHSLKKNAASYALQMLPLDGE